MKKKEYKKRLEKEKQGLKDLELSDSAKNIRNGIIISVSVIAFVFLMFTFTKLKTGEWNLFTKKNNVTYGAEIQSTKILCGSILNRSDSEYFVLAYELKEDNASLYESVLERYNSATNKLPVYKVDLSNSRNNICMGDSLNLSDNVADLKLTIPTLLHIKDSKIINSYTDYETIKNILNSYVD